MVQNVLPDGLLQHGDFRRSGERFYLNSDFARSFVGGKDTLRAQVNQYAIFRNWQRRRVGGDCLPVFDKRVLHGFVVAV